MMLVFDFIGLVFCLFLAWSTFGGKREHFIVAEDIFPKEVVCTWIFKGVVVAGVLFFLTEIIKAFGDESPITTVLNIAAVIYVLFFILYLVSVSYLKSNKNKPSS